MSAEIQRLSIVFFGTPGYAVPALEALLGRDDVQVSLVVTQPDRPAGRGRVLQAPPVKIAAERKGIPVYQPESLRTAESRDPLVAQSADLFVVAAYGLIFGRKTLAIPRLGCLNLHASLLPKYRGASPITAAILSGDRVTGVTLMQMDAGMDTGAVIATTKLEIEPTDTTGSLTERLASAGAHLLLESLRRFVDGDLAPMPQPEGGGSVVRPLVKADGWIVWNQPADAIERRIRAMQPWPRAWTTMPNGATLQIGRASLLDRPFQDLPGTVVVAGKRILVACSGGALALELVQPAGASEMPGMALISGRKLAARDRLGAVGAPEPPPPLLRELAEG